MKPLISIVTASKNYARFLSEALDSVLAQTLKDWELIVVDDGSTDDTEQVIQPYLTNPKIRYVKSDQLGQSRAKNLGIALSRGEFIAFLDADDAWEPTKLERQMPLFQNGVGVVFSRRSLMNELSQPQTGRKELDQPRGWVLNELFVQNFVCFSSVIVRRDIFDQVGRFDESLDLSIDYDLWLRVAKHTQFDYVNEQLVRYRTGHGNLSKRLLDRVATACSIMARSIQRGGIAPRMIAKGYASTYRTLAYILRSSETSESVHWYAQAMRWPHRRVSSFKGLIKAVIHGFISPRIPGPAENAAINR